MADAGMPPRRPPLIELLPGAARLMARTIEQQALGRAVEALTHLNPAVVGVNQRLLIVPDRIVPDRRFEALVGVSLPQRFPVEVPEGL